MFFNNDTIYYIVGFYFCLAIIIDWLIIDINLFFPLKAKYLIYGNNIFVNFIFIFFIFFISFLLYYFYINVNVFNIHIYNIEDAKFVLDDNFRLVLFGDNNPNKFSISFRCVSNIIAAIYSAMGFSFGLIIAKKNNNFFLFSLSVWSICIEIALIFLKKFF